MFATITMSSSGNDIINGLWIGNTLSSLELITINSFIANGHIFRLWVYEPIATPLPKGVIISDASEIIPADKIFRYKHNNQFGHGKNSLAGFSDLFRYKLLYEKGGWWVDMDVTCLKHFDFEADYVFRNHHKLLMVGNIMKCPQGSELMLHCYEEALTQVNAENRDWMLPIKILNTNIKKLGLEKHITVLSNKDSWYDIRKFFGKEMNLPTHWYALHWNNEELGRNSVNKAAHVANSLYGKLIAKYSIQNTLLQGIDAAKYKFKLSLTFFVINYFYKRFL